MTETDVHLVTASSRTATFSVDAHRHLYALDQRLNWRVTGDDVGSVASGRTSSVVFTVSGLEPDTVYDLLIGDATLSFSTSAESAIVDIRDFGASPELEDNADAIAEAISALPLNGTLRIPPGFWRSGPLYLKSQMTLLIENGAELSSLSDWNDREIFPARHDDGRVFGTWEGVAEPTFASIINAIDCEGLTITGGGIIDGGGDRGDWWTWPKESRRGARRPRILFLSGCRDLTLTGFTVRNSPSWTVHPVLCDRVLAADLRIENEPDSPNTDGFNPECCQDVRLIGLFISVGDDCIAIKAGKKHPLGGPNRPTKRIDILNCLMERGHGAVVMGSEMSAGVHDINISRCHFIGTDRGLRIKTRRGRGGEVANISLIDCRMENVATPIAVNAFYFCDADGRSDYVQSRTALPVTADTPILSGLTLRNVDVFGAGTAAAVFYGLPEAPIRDVVIENYHVTFNPDAEPEIAEMACDLPALRHAGIVAENTQFRKLVGFTPHPSIRTRMTEPMLHSYFDDYARDYEYYKGGAWCYEDGCLYRGLIALYEATGEQRWLDHLLRLVSGQIDERNRLAGYRVDEFNIDNVLAGRALTYLHTLTGEARWLEVAKPLAGQLHFHPRTQAGPYWHKLRYPHQVWLDGLYMALPFKLEYANAAGLPQLREDAVSQFLTALDLTYDAASSLYRHGYDESRLQGWADQETGHSPVHWARAIGWLAMAFVDIIEHLPQGDQRQEIARRAGDLAAKIKPLQTTDGRWLQVIDRPDVKGNYAESSATAMFAYFFLKGARLGVQGITPEPGQRAFSTLVTKEMKADAKGRVQLQNICCVAGLGGFEGVYRSGTVDYYLSEAIRADDIKGVAPLMMAYAEIRKAGEETPVLAAAG